MHVAQWWLWKKKLSIAWCHVRQFFFPLYTPWNSSQKWVPPSSKHTHPLHHYLTDTLQPHAPLSAILIRDKTQWSTSISLMRYEFGPQRKSEMVCCFPTNPLKVIWSPAANYRAILHSSSRLHRTPPSPFSPQHILTLFHCSWISIISS